ncbi:TVP38/TMEM64 family protein [Kitasatospora paracochleata]|uniref:TVP38/TMEM64 family membrane protein n=1 Tax=Kitasatospora paracochleata TaxID=58354 RepID=A0ABT1J7W9_9ACTN|nr:TVP38/TMEM64 family protein [Kitasatospora paracochleata]MCP2313530.1 putative membrane protein YdjX (TVP38/TMEM64 family) [Kitasatospora paracochleata]
MPALLRSPWLRLALLLVVLAAAAGSLLLWDPAQVLAAASGPYRMPVALAAYAFGTIAFLPRPALNAAMGLLFGAVWGVPLAVAGSALGAIGAFALGRALGRDALRPLLRAKVLSAIDRRLTEQGFRSVLLLRLFPGAPFQAGNFACAFSGVRFWPYLAATVLGVVPTTTAYVVAGASAGTPGSPAFLISTGVILAMCVFSAVSLWRVRVRSKTNAAPAEAAPVAVPTA